MYDIPIAYICCRIYGDKKGTVEVCIGFATRYVPDSSVFETC